MCIVALICLGGGGRSELELMITICQSVGLLAIMNLW
jgi:hypothetical protein